MRNRNFLLKPLIKWVFLIFLLTLSVTETVFAQTEAENAEKLWNLRQSEIEQLYQEGNLASALNSAQEAVSLAEQAVGGGGLRPR